MRGDVKECIVIKTDVLWLVLVQTSILLSDPTFQAGLPCI